METIIDAFVFELGDNFFRHAVFHYAVVFYLFLVTVIMSVADLCYAVSTARKLGERVRSNKLRKTLQKITLYWGFQLLSAAVGSIGLLLPWYNLPYLTIVATAAIVVVESKSLLEHFKRRKDHMTKLPEAVQDIVDLIGKERLREIAAEAAAKRLSAGVEPKIEIV